MKSNRKPPDENEVRIDIIRFSLAKHSAELKSQEIILENSRRKSPLVIEQTEKYILQLKKFIKDEQENLDVLKESHPELFVWTQKKNESPNWVRI